MSNMTRYRMVVQSDQRPASNSTNVQLRATSDPALPQGMRAALLPLALCNGTLVTSRSPLLSRDLLYRR